MYIFLEFLVNFYAVGKQKTSVMIRVLGNCDYIVCVSSVAAL
jgi:hypothetical protein